MQKIYRLEDGRLWEIEKARFIQEEQLKPGHELIDLVNAGGVADLAYLIKTLNFYGHELGALDGPTEEGLKARLARLDAEYLPPRTLAGLATGDAEALTRWREHEEKTAPLRKKFRELETAE